MKRVMKIQFLLILILCVFVGSTWADRLPIVFTDFNYDGNCDLMNKLVDQGYGNNSLQWLLGYLAPYSEGAISTSFMAAIAATPSNSDVKTVALSTFVVDYPICANDDGLTSIQPIYAEHLVSKEGYTTFTKEVDQLGTSNSR